IAIAPLGRLVHGHPLLRARAGDPRRARVAGAHPPRPARAAGVRMSYGARVTVGGPTSHPPSSPVITFLTMGLNWLIATAVVSLAGCGSVVGPHAAPDADVTDADATGMATVVTHTHYTNTAPAGVVSGAIQGMVDIISLRPNGTVAEMARTDASGMATIHVYPGGSVTAAYQHANDMGWDFATFFGVKPGDNLNFGHAFGASNPQSLGNMTLSWPARAGASFYDIFTGCTGVGVGGTSYTITEYDDCHQDPMYVLAIAYDSVGNPLSSSSTPV